MSTGLKALIAAAVLTAVGGVIYYFTRGRKGAEELEQGAKKAGQVLSEAGKDEQKVLHSAGDAARPKSKTEPPKKTSGGSHISYEEILSRQRQTDDDIAVATLFQDPLHHNPLDPLSHSVEDFSHHIDDVLSQGDEFLHLDI